FGSTWTVVAAQVALDLFCNLTLRNVPRSSRPTISMYCGIDWPATPIVSLIRPWNSDKILDQNDSWRVPESSKYMRPSDRVFGFFSRSNSTWYFLDCFHKVENARDIIGSSGAQSSTSNDRPLT